MIKISKNDTVCLKGIMAILVLIHNIYQVSGIFHESILAAVFQDLGYVAVAVFFFLSGYGLSISYRQKKDVYMREFLRNRILVLYCNVLFLIALYTVFELVLGNVVVWQVLLTSLTYGETVIRLGWYLQASLILYLAFYFIFRTQKSDIWKYNMMLGVVLVYIVICILLQFSPTRYITIIAFNLGMFWDFKADIIAKSFRKKIAFKYVFLAVIFGALFLVSHLLETYVLKKILGMLFSLCFVVLTVLTVQFVKIDCKATRFLGKISMEIYVSQGLFLVLFHEDICYIANPYIYVILVTTCTFLFSVGLNQIFTQMAKRIKGN